MGPFICDVRDIARAERTALEQLVGQTLSDDQRLLIQIVPAPDPVSLVTPAGSLPEWCDVYAGLTPEQVDDLERSIVRTTGSRAVD